MKYVVKTNRSVFLRVLPGDSVGRLLQDEATKFDSYAEAMEAAVAAGLDGFTVEEVITPVRAAALLARPGEGIEEALERVEKDKRPLDDTVPINRPARTLGELAKEAIDIQDAVNLGGLVHGWSKAVTGLRACLPDADTERINQHPINVLWALKLLSLALGRESFAHGGEYAVAYGACSWLAAAGKEAP